MDCELSQVNCLQKQTKSSILQRNITESQILENIQNNQDKSQNYSTCKERGTGDPFSRGKCNQWRPTQDDIKVAIAR